MEPGFDDTILSESLQLVSLGRGMNKESKATLWWVPVQDPYEPTKPRLYLTSLMGANNRNYNKEVANIHTKLQKKCSIIVPVIPTFADTEQLAST
eukprot:g12227.t1